MATTIITTKCGAKVHATTIRDGVLIATGLTACCEAAPKGTFSTGGHVVRCKQCYEVVDPAFGGTPRASVRAAVRAANCPIPDECTDHTMWQAEREVLATA